MKKPVFIAHRASWKPGRRENTQAAIERAANSGRFAYIEIDVRRTRSSDDGTQTPIVIHDETLDRLYKQYKIPKSKQHRIGQNVRGLSIDIIRSEEIEVLTLADALRSLNGHPVNIELKDPDCLDATLEIINDVIAKYPQWSHEKIVVSSFDWDMLKEIKQREPNLGLAMAFEPKHLLSNFGRTYNSLGCRWIGFSKWLIAIMGPWAKMAGVPNRYCFTLNSKIGINIARKFAVNGIFTDVVTMPEQFGD